MKKTFLFICLSLFAFVLYGQNTKTLKIINNSGSIIRKAINAADQGKYDDAIALYNQIPYGDPNYETAQYEKAYSLELSERYQEAIAIFKELLENPSCSLPKANIYTELGNCYDEMEDYETAVNYYSEGLVDNPYYFHLHFNKGVSLMRQEKYAEAIECFKTSMFLSPAHQGSHFQYGMACLRLGYTIPGIMALNYCTLINPSARYTILALQTLDEIYDSGVGSFNANNHYTVHENYKELNKFYEDVVTKLNLSIISQKKEKCLSKINHAVTRGNQVVFQNVQVRPNSHAVEDQLYIPFFKQVMEKKLFNTFCHYQLSSTDIENGKVSAKAEKMGKEIGAFVDMIVEDLDNVIEKGLNKENPDGIYYRYDQFRLFAWGKASKNENGKLMQQGEWTSIDQTGQLDEISTYKDGELDGMGYGYENNRKIAEVQMSKGKREGFIHAYSYHPFGNETMPTLEANAVNDKIQGRYKLYSDAGILSMDCFFGSDEQLVGESRHYDEQGHLSLLETYVDGKPTGPQKTYYPNGQLRGEYETDNTNTPHPLVMYYPNGRVNVQGFITDNERSGNFTERYPDGTLKESYSYNDKGELDGEYLEYYPNGKMWTKTLYRNGKPDEERTEYDYDGKLAATFHIKDGQASDVVTYNPDGSVRSTVMVKDKHLAIDLYTSLGRLFCSNVRNSKFDFDGKQTTFYSNGDILTEQNYKKGELNGITKSYYPSGQVYTYVEYKNDALNGLYVNYHDDKAHTVAKECQYRNDTLVGASYTYLEDGTLSNKELYDSEGKLIYCAYYMPNGKMSREIRYFNGLPLIINTFDTDGKIVVRDTVLFGNGYSNYFYPNGNIQFRREIKGGKLDGALIHYSLDGRIIDSCLSLSSSRMGSQRMFYPTGETADSCSVTLDIIDGYSLSYDPLGRQKHAVYFGGNEKAQGSEKEFYPDGKTLKESNNMFGDPHGSQFFYAPDGKTVLFEIIYDHGSPYQYIFRQADGKFSDAKTLPKEHIQITSYYPNGKTGMVVEFENGFFHGNFIIYHPNGQAAYTAQYTHGMMDDHESFFYANGKTSVLRSYHLGELHGAMEYYYENGQKAYEGNYYYGLCHGDFKKYDKSGKLVHKVTMYYDRCTADERY